MASLAAALSCPPPPLPRFWIRRPQGRRFRLPCARPQPRLRSTSRPDRPPARSRRALPARYSNPCSPRRSRSPLWPSCWWAPSRRVRGSSGKYRLRRPQSLNRKTVRRESPNPVRSPRSPMTPSQSPHPGGCSSSAACSIRRASRCRTPRPWFMRGARHSGFHRCKTSSIPYPSAMRAPTDRGGSTSTAPRTSSSRYDTVGAVAIAPGYGVGCVELDPDADQPAADITLRREQVIHGRLFDVQGRPVPDVAISVSGVRPDARSAACDSWLLHVPRATSLFGGRMPTTFRHGPGRRRPTPRATSPSTE